MSASLPFHPQLRVFAFRVPKPDRENAPSRPRRPKSLAKRHLCQSSEISVSKIPPQKHRGPTCPSKTLPLAPQFGLLPNTKRIEHSASQTGLVQPWVQSGARSSPPLHPLALGLLWPGLPFVHVKDFRDDLPGSIDLEEGVEIGVVGTNRIFFHVDTHHCSRWRYREHIDPRFNAGSGAVLLDKVVEILDRAAEQLTIGEAVHHCVGVERLGDAFNAADAQFPRRTLERLQRLPHNLGWALS